MLPRQRRIRLTRRRAYWRYIKPHVKGRALADFTIGEVTRLLETIALSQMRVKRPLNSDTLAKIRSVLSAIFTHALQHGAYPGRTLADNPAHGAAIPAFAAAPKEPPAATREEVKAMLRALSGRPLERATIGVIAMAGMRPGEAAAPRWETVQ